MRMLINRKYDVCPACKKDMMIGMEVEVDEADITIEDGGMTAKNAVVLGCVTSHDCRKPVKRAV